MQHPAEPSVELPPVTSESISVTPLTPRQQAFVEQYLIDLNAMQAAIRAGYAPAGANTYAAQLIRLPHVAAAIEQGKAQRLSRVNMTADTVLSEMAALALSNVSHYVISDEGQVKLAEGAPPNAMAAVQSIKRKTRVYFDKALKCEVREYEVELKLWDKPSPLKLMGRHANVAAFFDKVEVTGKGGGPIEIAAVALETMTPEQLLAAQDALTKKLAEVNS